MCVLGVHLQKYSSLTMLVDCYSCISTLLPGGPNAKIHLSAKFCLLVVKPYMLYNLYDSFYSHCFVVVVLFVIVVHV